MKEPQKLKFKLQKWSKIYNFFSRMGARPHAPEEILPHTPAPWRRAFRSPPAPKIKATPLQARTAQLSLKSTKME
jgi:hypothetical protein